MSCKAVREGEGAPENPKGKVLMDGLIEYFDRTRTSTNNGTHNYIERVVESLEQYLPDDIKGAEYDNYFIDAVWRRIYISYPQSELRRFFNPPEHPYKVAMDIATFLLAQSNHEKLIESTKVHAE